MLYKVLISLNDKGKWLIFLFCLNREGHNRSKSEDDKPIVPDHDLMYDRNGSRPLTSTRYAKLKCTDDCIKENQSYFFQETGLDLIILLKFLFLWNIWPFYKITCIFTFITEVRVEPDPRTLIRGHWREPRLVSSLLLFGQVSRIYMNVHLGYLSFTSILL